MNLSEAAKKLDVLQPTLTRWLQAGLVKPEVWAQKPGTEVQINEQQLRELHIVSTLRRAGVSFQKIRELADTLREWGCNPLSEGEFIVVADGEEVIRRVDEDEATALLQNPGQQVLSLEPVTSNDED